MTAMLSDNWTTATAGVQYVHWKTGRVDLSTLHRAPHTFHICNSITAIRRADLERTTRQGAVSQYCTFPALGESNVALTTWENLEWEEGRGLCFQRRRDRRHICSKHQHKQATGKNTANNLDSTHTHTRHNTVYQHTWT